MATTRLSFSFLSSLGILFALALNSCVNIGGASSPSSGLIRKNFSPTWGPDGQRVAFLYRYRPEGSQEVKDSLYTVLLNGTDLVKVRSLTPARFKSVSWSPDGAYFLLSAEDTEELYLTERNGQNLEKISEGDQASWHPTDLKFVSTYDNECQSSDRIAGKQCQRQIRLFDLRSRTHVALPLTLKNPVISPAWSKDGLKIQWLSTATEQSKEQARRIVEFHSYNLASQEYQITEIEPTEQVFANAEWSQDRSLMTYSYLSKIHLYFFNQKRFFNVTPGIDPTLSPDNGRILYTNLIGENKGDITLFDRNSSTVTTVISHRNLPAN